MDAEVFACLQDHLDRPHALAVAEAGGATATAEAADATVTTTAGGSPMLDVGRLPAEQGVARLIDQIKREHVPAIFGSEVFPSPVLAQIASETGVRFESTLRDDDLPGNVGGPMHSYVGLIVYDVQTMVGDLGGSPSSLDGIPTHSRYD